MEEIWIKVCVQNCRSLVKNLSQFQSFVYATDFQIIGLSETWLFDNITDLEILPQAYSLYWKDRGSRGGGVMLAVSNILPSRQVPSPHNLEVVTVSIFLSNTDITCCMIYIPPNASAEYHSNLVNYLNTISAQSAPVLLLGDFNSPDINWSTLAGSSTASNNLCKFIFESNLVQLVDSPTHANSPDHVTNLLVHPPDYHQCVTSDHYLITFTITFEHLVSPPTINEVFNFTKGDYTGLSEYLLSRDLSSIYKSSDIEEIWHLLKSNITRAMVYLSPKQDYVLGNFLLGLHLSCGILASVSVHFSGNLIKILQPAIIKGCLKPNNLSMLPTLLPSLHMNRI